MKNLKGENSTIILLVVFALVVIIAKLFLIDFYYVSSNSMLPILKKGDVVLLFKKGIVNCESKSNVIVFYSPEDNKKLVKRYGGISGEQMSKFGLQDRMLEYSDRKIPENHFFALGDNSADSYDSRYFGPVLNSNIIGKVELIIWSADSNGTNWHRFFNFVK